MSFWRAGDRRCQSAISSIRQFELARAGFDVTPRHTGEVVERRIEVRSGDAKIGPRLLHTLSGDLDVVVVAQAACPCGVVFESEEENLTPVPVWGKDRPSCYQHTRGCVRSCDSVRVDICGYVDKM